MKLLRPALLLLLAPLVASAAVPVETAADPAALAAKGNVAWRAEDRGAAVLLWERALILDPSQPAARAGLAVAADAGAKSPSPAPIEVYASTLPENVWAIVAAAAFWTAVVALALPAISRIPRRSSQHTLAGVCGAVLLLAIPGVLGAMRHRERGVVVAAGAPLLLTPTRTGEVLQKLEAGDRVRLAGTFGDYRRVITADGSPGWMRDASVTPVIPGK